MYLAHVRHLLPLAVIVLVTACPVACAQRRTSINPLAPGCQVNGVADATLTVDGHTAYVEPQAFVSSGDRLLLAGTPTFLWEAHGPIALVPGDSIIGAMFDTSGRVRPLVSPIEARLVSNVRATATANGSWAVMFAEAEPARPRDTPRVTAYWFGITDGVRWTNLTRLPIENGAPSSIAASPMVRTRDGFAVAVPINRGERSDVLVLEWNGARLESEILETKWAAYVALTSTEAGDLLLGVVRPDTTEQQDENSLFLYGRRAGASSWQALPRLVRGEGQPVRDPLIDTTGARIVVTWRATTASTADAKTIIAPSLARAVPPPALLGRNVEQVLETSHRGVPVWVLTTQPAPANGARIRVIIPSDTGLTTIADLASPFQRPIAGAWRSSRLLLTSGVPARTPTEPPVQSHLLSIDFRCGAAP